MERDALQRIRVQPGKRIGISVDLVADLGTKVLTSVLFVMVAAGYSSGDHSGHAEETRPKRNEAEKPAGWNLYKDAILETNQGQLPDRISDSGSCNPGPCVARWTGFKRRANRNTTRYGRLACLEARDGAKLSG